jgi:hypothetical protein
MDGADNALCRPWTCSPNYLGGGDGCDCGCGLIDPDCASAASGACAFCTESGSCAEAGSCADIAPANNGTCI